LGAENGDESRLVIKVASSRRTPRRSFGRPRGTRLLEVAL